MVGHFCSEKESGDLFWINQTVDVDPPMHKNFFIFTA